MPLVQEKVKEFLERKLRKMLNEASSGAAIKGAVLAGDVTDVLLLDVFTNNSRHRDNGWSNDTIN